MKTPLTTIELASTREQEILVRQLKLARKRIKQPEVDFDGRLTSVTIADTMHGSSTLTLELLDPDHSLLESGFFDVRSDGKLDPIEINYPVGSKDWWRLTSLDMDAGHRLTMTLMERIAVEMQQMKGPLKTTRAKKTRAQFIKMLVDRTAKKSRHGVVYVCKQLTKKQDRTKPTKDKDKSRKEQKASGIALDSKIKFKNWDGSSYTLKRGELKNAEAVLDTCDRVHAPEKATLACLTACIVEGPFFRNPSGGDASSAGILQLLSSWGSIEKRRDIEWVVEKFLKEGFYGKRDPSVKGAIDAANKHPDWTVGEIAQETQGSAFGDRYEKVRGGAEKVLEAYGGGTFGGTTYEAAYNFTVGGRDNPKESYWDAAQRLAEEVRWALFIDGDHVYYDSEQTLIGQMAAAVVERDSPYVVDWSATWDERHIATDVTISLICDPFEFRAGEVFQLVGFGPLSTGSTADPKKRPGFWLISEMNRNIGNLSTEFTLKQPQNPKKEPRGETRERRTGGETSSDLLDAMAKISKNTPGYLWGGGHGPALSSLKFTDGLDCSGSCSYALWLAGMWPSGLKTALTSMDQGGFGDQWGESGRGETFTVWQNNTHVFMLSEGPGEKWRFDTGGPGGGKGPKLHKGASGTRPTTGFHPRHWKGA
jgi:hypothetical protein